MKRPDQSGKTSHAVLAILVLIGFLAWAFYSQSKGPGTPAASQASHTAPHGPIYDGVPKSKEPLEILTNKGYVVGYSEKHKDPVWVAYRLFKAPSAHNPRPLHFEEDPRTSGHADEHDYSRSGYDRGHLAPNEAIDDCYGPEAQRESFLMSNIVPQRPKLNREVWEHLEHRILHDWAPRYGEVWVVTGPVFSAHPRKLKGGEDIPDACYKIVVEDEGGKPHMIAFIIPQDVQGTEPLERFLTSVKEIEKETGLDFFPEMPQPLQDQLETEVAKGVW